MLGRALTYQCTGKEKEAGAPRAASRKRKMVQPIFTLLCVLVFGFLALRWLERHMIFHPDRVIYGAPADIGLKHEEVWLTTQDGVRIHGWFLPADDATAAPPSPAVAPERQQAAGGTSLVCLFFCGNAGNISARLEKLRILHDAGLAVLIIDYRGYGRSAGRPSEIGTYRDADAAYRWLVAEKRIEPHRVVLYGESLGCGVAIDLAAREKVGAVIVESGFTSVPDKAAEIYPFLPVRWLVKTKYDNLAKIRRITVPLLIMHSREDEIFSFRHAERLWEAANQPKELFEMHGDHNGAFLYTGQRYARKLREFVAALGAAAGERR